MRFACLGEHTGRTTAYGYDDLYRLTGETLTDAVNGDYHASYQYDRVGNRSYSIVEGVHTAYSYDANDRLTQQGGTHYSHDPNGNTLTETTDGLTVSYGYNAKNERVEVNQGGTPARYRYNSGGIRTAKTEGGVTTRYVVDSHQDYAQVLEESDGTRTVSYQYGHDLISQQRDGQTHYYHYDGLGSTRALSDDGGTITDRYDYEAFGTLLNQTGSTENNYRFTGEQYDTNVNQYYLRARYYDPAIGRFTQMDTWMGRNQDPITLHKYLYANADPVMYTDPTGYFGLAEFSVANNIRMELASIQVDVGSQFASAATDPNSASPSATGWGVILAAAPVPLKFLSRNITQIRKGSGWVRYVAKKGSMPEPKEIAAAEFLAERIGAKIYIRGKGVKGTDFLMDGLKWELKTLKSPTNNAVANNIKKSLKKGNQGSRFIIDGRVGLTKEEALRGISRAMTDGYTPSAVKFILKDGSILNWP